MAEIAVALREALEARALTGTPGEARARTLAQGEGFQVDDVLCTSGPEDRAFEEQHGRTSIAVVAAGTFQYRCARGEALMTPGALMLGNAGQRFECAHEHGVGDRCIAFRYAPAYFEQVAADAGARGRTADLRPLRVPPARSSAPLVARACAGLSDGADHSWEELALELLAYVLHLSDDVRSEVGAPPPAAVARVTRAVRLIEDDPSRSLTLAGLAREARLSPFHFLRTFERLTGLTPHQYVRRARLRAAAVRLIRDRDKIVDIALGAGFGDVSNFNRSFRAEFATSPRAYRDEAGSRRIRSS